MSSQALPRTVSVRKAVRVGSDYSGPIEFSALPRLADALVGAAAPFAVRLAFAESEGGKQTVHARVQGEVSMECQRCLQPVSIALQADSLLTVVAHDAEARSTLRDVDPLLLQGDELDVYGLVEEEVLLALPIVALHDSESCSPVVSAPAADEAGAAGAAGADPAEQEQGDGSRQRDDNPFAVLGQLKPERE